MNRKRPSWLIRLNWKNWVYGVTATILALLAILSMGIYFKTLGEWFRQLDGALDASFYATTAGLSLAAAAFLFNPLERARKRISRVQEGTDGVIEGLERSKIRDLPDEVTDSISSAIDRLEERRDQIVGSLRETIVNLTQVKNYFVYSFRFFVVGLIGALTIDLWSDAGEVLANQNIQGWDGFFTLAQFHMWLVADAGVALATAGFGIFFLTLGSLKLSRDDSYSRG